MKIIIGKRLYGRNKFRWFYSPMLKENMKSGGIIIFWWLGHNWYFCLKKTNGKCVFENGKYIWKKTKANQLKRSDNIL